MVAEAEMSGRLQPGDTIIEPTSGNTGIGLALAAAVKGYRCIIVLPEKMSKEKVDTMKALGAEIVRTPTEAAWDAPESHINVAKRLNESIPRSHILDQYTNTGNPSAHYEGTAEEILYSLDGKVDMLVAGAGTGGTVSGTAKKLKEKCPDIHVVGVDPFGSILARPESLNKPAESYLVEGIGYDFIPEVMKHEYVDEWVKTNDEDAFITAREIIRKEGLLCGGSSGCAMHVALEKAKSLKEGQNCVVVLPDGVRNYMTKFLSDDWMMDHGLIAPDAAFLPKKEEEAKWAGYTVKDLDLPVPVCVDPTTPCGEAIKTMEENHFNQVPVCDGKNVVGVVTLGNLLSFMSHMKIKSNDPVSKVMFKFNLKSPYFKITLDTPISGLITFFDANSVAIVTDGKSREIKSLVTKVDMLKFLVQLEGK
eukprot:Nk52_evm21s240 gene=Nk52_evmTU21s240